MKDSPDGSIALSLRLIKVNEFARHGRLKEAKALLAPNGVPPENPIELETFAGLVTREGDYPRALRLWQTLLQRDPRHAEARRMIDALEVWMARPPWFQFLPVGAGAALLLLVVVAWWTFSGKRPASPVNAPSPLVAAPTTIRPTNGTTPPLAPPTSAPAAAKPKEDPPAVKFQLAPTPRPKK